MATMYVNTDHVNGGIITLHPNPDNLGSLLKRIPNGTQLEVSEYDKLWYIATYDGASGYVWGEYMNYSAGGISVNSPVEIPGTDVHIRNYYLTLSMPIGMVSNVTGTVMQIQNTSDHYTWYKINIKSAGLNGWVRGDLIKPYSDENSIYLSPIRACAKEGVLLYANCGTDMIMGYSDASMHDYKQVSGQPGWLKMGYYCIPAIDVKLDPKTTTHQNQIRNTTEKVYVRETFGLSNWSYCLNENTPVVVLDTISNDDYYRIGTSEGIGWVPASGIKL
jgi:uncharacterized protein YgiM (DUF1202 family)